MLIVFDISERIADVIVLNDFDQQFNLIVGLAHHTILIENFHHSPIVQIIVYFPPL